MKKHYITVGLSVLALSAATFGQLAMAQSAPTNIELAQLLPPDVDQLIEFNTGATNPLGPLETSFLDNFTNGSTSADLSAQNAASAKQILTNELPNNKFTTATKNKLVTQGGYSYPQSDTYASMHMTTDDYTKLVALFPSSVTNETVDGMTVYSYSSTFYLTMVGNLVVATSTHDRMTALLDLYSKNSGPTLAQNEDYTLVRQKDLAGSFLNMYLNPAGYQTTSDALMNSGSADTMGIGMVLSAEKNLMGSLKAEGTSVSQSTTGFNFSVFIKGDQVKLSSLNLSFDRYNFVPSIYKFINSKNVMLFGEQSNLQGKIQDIVKIFAGDTSTTTAYNNWKDSFKTASNIDFDSDILPLFKNNYSISVHQTNQIWPAVTLVVDIHNLPGQALDVLTKFVNYIDKSATQAEKDQNVNFYNKTTASFNGTSYYEMTFDPTKSADTSGILKTLPLQNVMLYLHAGVTSGGYLVITNAPVVSDVYTLDGQGMLANSSFGQAFTNPNETVAGLAYSSFDNLHSYINMLMDTFNAPTEARDFAKGLLDPWHDFYTKAYATPDTSLATGFVNVDSAGLAKYGDLFNQYFASVSQNIQQVEQSIPIKKSFCDVHAGDWYAPYVDDLSQNNIVNGYADGCFRPNNQITRAEFIKMIAQVSVLNSMSSGTDPGKKYFSDVQSNNEAGMFISNGTAEWYAVDVNNAAASDIIAGYNDGSFRPNAPITRAEAVQILYNMSATLKVTAMQMNNFGQPVGSLTNFNDVHNNDWYMNAVAAAYYNKLVSGTSSTTFDPNRNLTRAEAAKIIKLFRDLSNSQMTP